MEVWRVGEEWWRERPIRRTYFQLVVQSGQTVTVSILEPYRDQVTEDAAFRLRLVNWGSEARYVELVPGEGKRAGRGAVFAGESGVDDGLRRLFDWTFAKGESPEVQREIELFQDQVEDLFRDAEDLAETGKAEWEKKREELSRDTEALVEEARRQGADAAGELRVQLDALLREWEEALEPSAEGDTI